MIAAGERSKEILRGWYYQFDGDAAPQGPYHSQLGAGRAARAIIIAKADAAARQERRHQAPEGECPYCDGERAKGNTHHPSHDASPRCESGKRNHCTCDTCW